MKILGGRLLPSGEWPKHPMAENGHRRLPGARSSGRGVAIGFELRQHKTLPFINEILSDGERGVT